MPTPVYSERDVAAAAGLFYGVVLTTDQSRAMYVKLVNLAQNNGWVTRGHTTCGLAVWIKSRLLEMGLLEVPQLSPSDLSRPVELNVFFLHIEETPEQLARLANQPVEQDEAPARSRLTRYMATKTIRPVNKTALKVARPPSDGQ